VRDYLLDGKKSMRTARGIAFTGTIQLNGILTTDGHRLARIKPLYAKAKLKAEWCADR
jgi:hypothetical protein